MLNVKISSTDHESKKGTSNLLDETVYLIVVCKIDVFFCILKR